MIDIEKYRVEIALKVIENDPLDMDDEIDFWIYHFNIKYNQICEKYNFENNKYDFIIFLFLKFIKTKSYSEKCKHTIGHPCYCENDITNSTIYNYIYNQIDWIIHFISNKYSLNDHFNINDLNEKDSKLYNYLYSDKSYKISYNLYYKNNQEMINELFECYNLKIKFISPAAKYLTVR